MEIIIINAQKPMQQNIKPLGQHKQQSGILHQQQRLVKMHVPYGIHNNNRINITKKRKKYPIVPDKLLPI